MWNNSHATSQFIFLIIALIALFVTSKQEYRNYKSYIYLVFFIILAILGILLLFGSIRHGTKGWFDLGIFMIQPSEFAKPIFIIALATFFSHQVHHTLWQVIQSLLFLIPICVLILMQPDFGTMVVFLATWMIMVLALRLKLRIKIALSILGLTMIALAITSLLFFLPENHFQRQRLLTYPEHLMLEMLRK